MIKNKVTIRAIEDVVAGSRDVILWDTDLPGFHVKITPKGKRGYFLYYRTSDHRQRRPRIGSYPELKPEQARNIARSWLAEVRSGGDPSLKRMLGRSSRGQGTLEELFDTYKVHKKKEARRSSDEIERIFEHDILPVFGKRKVEDVATHEVSRLLDKISRRSPSVAWAARRQLSAFYNWVIPRVPGASNPVTYASKPPKVNSRERVLTNGELKKLWQSLEHEKEPWKTAVRLLVLTGQRRSEVLYADWSEFDLKKKIWTIPAKRAKNGQSSLVPLGPEVMALLKALPNSSGLLFPHGTGRISQAAKRIRGRMHGVPDWRWHDLRRTVATGLQRLRVRLEVTEAILNHTSGTRAGIVGVYQRHDWAKEKRDALEKWGREVLKIVGSAPAEPRSTAGAKTKGKSPEI